MSSSIVPPSVSSGPGAIFDWDGVIIDSSSHHEESWERLASEIGRTLPPGHFKKGFGMKNEVIIPNVLGWTQDADRIQEYSLRKEELYRQIVVERGIAPLPGVATLLTRMQKRGIPCAIGSSTHRLNIETALNFLGFGEFFISIVSAEDVSHGKPHPEVFLTAAARIHRHPTNCIVFEDAVVGIEAAHRGGMRAVAVATTHPIESLDSADLAVTRLDQLSAEQFENLFPLPRV
jgi:HAD superfamily hydrolase (TIGR01509 family)